MSLEERLESGLPSAWRPDQDDADKLIGKVVDVQVGESDYGRYPIVIVRQEDGTEKTVHGFHSVLRSELKKAQPQIGERVGFKYLGDVETKPGSKFKSYKGYRVSVEREGGTFNWETIDQAPREEPARVIYEETVTVPAGAGDDDIPF